MGLQTAQLTKPAKPLVVATGAGAVRYTYKATARTFTGETEASVASDAVTNAALDSTHYNDVSITPVPGAKDYRIWRSTDGFVADSTRITTGGVDSLATYDTYLRDNGITGMADTPPAVYTTDNAKLANVAIGGGTKTSGLTWNATATVADGGTIAHRLGAAPTACIVTGSVAAEIVTATYDATNITVAIKKRADGSAGTLQTINWACMK
jgi:hypothetical protein